MLSVLPSVLYEALPGGCLGSNKVSDVARTMDTLDWWRTTLRLLGVCLVRSTCTAKHPLLVSTGPATAHACV